MSEQEIFDNNLKCQDYMSALTWDWFSYEEDGYKNSVYWYNIFYSPITNSCLWTFEKREIFTYEGAEYSTEVSNYIVSLFWGDWAWFVVRYNNDWSKYCYGTTQFTWWDWLRYKNFWCNDWQNPELADKAWEEEINRLKWN